MMSDSGAGETRKRSRHSPEPTSPTANAAVTSRPGRSCLLVVDVQNDFCTGSLKAPSALDIIPIINGVRASHDWHLVVFTGDAHPPDHVSFFVNHATNPAAQLFQPLQLPNGQEQVMWPVHCVKGTRGAELHVDLAREPTDVIVEKGTVPDQEYYSAFTSTCGRHHTTLDSLLRRHGITDVVACGLVHEYCVGNSAVDAAHAGYRTWLLTDATKGLTEEGVSKMNAKLDKAGVTRIESQELTERGFQPATASDSDPQTQAQGQQSSSPRSPQRALSWQRQDSTSSAMSCDFNYNPPSRGFSSTQPTPFNSLTPSHSFSAMPMSPSHSSSFMLSRANSTMSTNGNGPAAAATTAAAGTAASAGATGTSSPSAAVASSSASAPTSASAGPRPRVLLGLSGSVATIKAFELVQALSEWADVRVVCTAKSRHFFSARQLESQLLVKVYEDEDEWRDAPWKRGDPVLHVEVSGWSGNGFRRHGAFALSAVYRARMDDVCTAAFSVAHHPSICAVRACVRCVSFSFSTPSFSSSSAVGPTCL